MKNEQKVLNYLPKRALKSNHRKEKHFMQSYKLCAIYKNELLQIADLRIYGTPHKSYACLWISSYYEKGTKKHKSFDYASGSGSASGYGFHSPSEATAEALDKAGVSLSLNIGGRGDRAQEDALTALGKFLGYKNTYIVKAHG